MERRDARHRIKASRLSVDNVFHQGIPAFVTISSEAHGTVVYLDRSPSKTSGSFRIFSEDLTGQIVVGSSPVKNDNWSGQLRGLAIYRQALTVSEVLQRYRALETKHRAYSANDGRSVALYLFDEHSGNVVHNHGGSKVDLYIPEKYAILHEKFLEPAWKEFNLSWGYWKSALINIGGFVPLGFFCAYLSLTKPINRAAGGNHRSWHHTQPHDRGLASIPSEARFRDD